MVAPCPATLALCGAGGGAGTGWTDRIHVGVALGVVSIALMLFPAKGGV